MTFHYCQLFTLIPSRTSWGSHLQKQLMSLFLGTKRNCCDTIGVVVIWGHMALFGICHPLVEMAASLISRGGCDP